MSLPESARYGVSEEYWARMSEKDRELHRLFRPLRQSTYVVDYRIVTIEQTLKSLDEDARSQGGQLELDPDFQRGHVWSQEKQIAFMEAVIRGTAPLVIRFNCPAWEGSVAPEMVDGLNPHSVLCVDGLQRLTAMREFVAGKFKIFGGFSHEDLDDTAFSLRKSNMRWRMEMFNIASRADLLQFYLDLNSGGVVHSDDELQRVSRLLAAAKGEPQPSKGGGMKKIKA